MLSTKPVHTCFLGIEEETQVTTFGTLLYVSIIVGDGMGASSLHPSPPTEHENPTLQENPTETLASQSTCLGSLSHFRDLLSKHYSFPPNKSC